MTPEQKRKEKKERDKYWFTNSTLLYFRLGSDILASGASPEKSFVESLLHLKMSKPHSYAGSKSIAWNWKSQWKSQ